jgi:uncharacterized protein (TIGR02246 family)
MSKHLVQQLIQIGMMAIFLVAGNFTFAQETQTEDSSSTVQAAETATEEPASKTTLKKTKGEWQAAVAEVGEQFKAHYATGDAKAIAAMFTEAGEFIDSERVVYSGRKDIEVEFGALFEVIPVRKMELVVDSVRQVADSVVVEDGHAWIQIGEAATTVSQYCSVLVRDGDQWKIASLRDIKSEYASASDRLSSLDWIIGEWIDESDSGVVEYEFGWSEDNNFILGSYQIRNIEEEDFNGSVRIGWDAANKQFKSWLFDSEGGVSIGYWNPIDEGWIIKNTGTRSDGVVGSSTNYYQLVEDGRVLWKSFDRHVGGEKKPDVEVTLVRKPPVPGGEDADREGNRESDDDKDEKK